MDGITPGLQAAAAKLQQNDAFVTHVHALGNLYLEDGTTLLHGDFYPGSWVRTSTGPRVIDPEFGFFGPAAYDVGVCMAHLRMAGYEETAIKDLMQSYKPQDAFDVKRAHQFAGMEIMRRLIGVAQLPLNRSLEIKSALLDLAARLVLDPEHHKWID